MAGMRRSVAGDSGERTPHGLAGTPILAPVVRIAGVNLAELRTNDHQHAPVVEFEDFWLHRAPFRQVDAARARGPCLALVVGPITEGTQNGYHS